MLAHLLALSNAVSHKLSNVPWFLLTLLFSSTNFLSRKLVITLENDLVDLDFRANLTEQVIIQQSKIFSQTGGNLRALWTNPCISLINSFYNRSSSMNSKLKFTLCRNLGHSSLWMSCHSQPLLLRQVAREPNMIHYEHFTLFLLQEVKVCIKQTVLERLQSPSNK